MAASNISTYSTPEGFLAGTTLKDLSAPEAGNMALHACESREDILTNRRNLAALLDCAPEDFVCAFQCHSATFRKVTRSDGGRGALNMDTSIPETDALYTFEPNLLLCCFTADCVPLLLYDETTGLAGAVHSGWQGTVREITPKLLAHLLQVENCNPANLHIIIGPAISQAKFEVDRDVQERFKALGYADEFIYYEEKTGKYHIDNKLTVKRQCRLQGIPEENILVDDTCTFTSSHCFSYRRDKSCGRHLSYIMRKSFSPSK